MQESGHGDFAVALGGYNAHGSLRCHSLLRAGYSPVPANLVYHGWAIWMGTGAAGDRGEESALQGGFVFGLVQADFGAAGEAEFGDAAPAGFFDDGEGGAFLGEGGHFGF